jgi:putative ABC transport system permease protein
MRAILKNAKLNAIAALSLTVAMALGVVALSVSNALLFRLPGAKDRTSLVAIYTETLGKKFQNVSYLDYLDYRDRNSVFSDIAAHPYDIDKLVVSFENRDELATLCPVSENYFSVMGIQPVLGRFFAPGDDRGNTPAVVLTYAEWVRWNRDPAIVGKQMKINRKMVTIIGVAPKDFTGPLVGLAADIITHLMNLSEDELTRRDLRSLTLLARLKPGIGLVRARTDVQAISRRLSAAYPKADGDRTADVMPATILHPEDVSAARLIAGLLVVAVSFILLIACANACNVLLAIATGRRREALIKLALGASRARLIREFLMETALLCATSGVCAFALAAVALYRISEFHITLPGFGAFRIASDLHPNTQVIALSAAMVLIAAAAAGIGPALYASSPHLARALSGEVVIGGTKKGVIRDALVIVQVAVSTLVLVGVGLCYRSLENLRRVDPGFSARNLAAVPVFMEYNGFNESTGPKFYARLRHAGAQVYGVEAVALGQGLPLQLGGGGEEARAGGTVVQAGNTVVDGDYFSTVGIRLLSGRTFDASDTAPSPKVAVIGSEMARLLWPGQDPVGRTVQMGKAAIKVIGVVADVKCDSLDEAPRAFLYLPLSQNYSASIMLIARTQGDPRLWTGSLSRAVRSLGVRAPMPPITLNDALDLSLFSQILTLKVTGALSALALMLAVAGLFGAVSYSVRERKRELGIRAVLGAMPSHLFKMILNQTLVVTGAGVAIGLLLGIAASILLRSQFYGVRHVEWTALTPVAIAMTLIACLVAHVAARGAVHADPMDTLRHT